MPPRHAYWTIVVDDQPTAFRAHDPEELLPTLNRLREKNQSAVMKWFERGKLFDSRDEARDVGLGQGERRWEGPRPERDSEGRARGPARDADGPPRDKKWRPGGEHRDPRQKYRDAKKAKWTQFKDKIRARHEERRPPDDGTVDQSRSRRNPEAYTPPHGDALRPNRGGGGRDEFRPRGDADRGGHERGRSERGASWGGGENRGGSNRGGSNGGGFDRGGYDRPRPDSRDRRPPAQNRGESRGAPSRPHGDKLGPRYREDWRSSERRNDRDRPERSGPPRDRDRPWQRDRPQGGSREGERRGSDRDTRKPWGGGGRPNERSAGPRTGARDNRKPWGAKPRGPQSRPDNRGRSGGSGPRNAPRESWSPGGDERRRRRRDEDE